ncbi:MULTISPECIES: pyridoxamine 5'-phosphate oxidase family protein [Micromonospora]|uniref:PPOX class probable F420-dependent enzyme n=1 Tax=Micromonospora yangpuensis TaxID=683228 RepID=A0A1C6UFZ5_9ACTN|nr:TIGR03618 family F420-dependent PPOX class oxidoreductase [Micromonospora yangpuensis]GGM05567.1 PPOX class F420-dependent enzyme [Micromonospora yangpuensis]SCL52803.1 PPOX class probable F420-dependent enzyme [Micromonospora yangpuensis]
MQPINRSSTPAVTAFLAEDHLATVTTLRPDGRPHVVPVRFTWDPRAGLARVLTVASTRKARNVAAGPGGWAVLCQTVGFRWATLEGPATVSADDARVREAVRRYARRYRVLPPDPPGRVVLEIAVERVRSLNV